MKRVGFKDIDRKARAIGRKKKGIKS